MKKKHQNAKKQKFDLTDLSEVFHTDDPDDPITIPPDHPDLIPFEDPFETPEYDEPPEGP